VNACKSPLCSITGENKVRSSLQNLDVWPFSGPEEEVDGFDSFDPGSPQQRPFDPVRQASRAPQNFTRVLLAENDAYHRRVVRLLLNSPRVSLIEVEDGQAAVDLLALRSFDLVLLDIDMPRLSGRETLNWIRRSLTPWADIPVIALVDEEGRNQVGRMMSMGLTDWTAKPLSRRDLIAKMVSVLPDLKDAGL
jgi:CheY-like chemotaxis protein